MKVVARRRGRRRRRGAGVSVFDHGLTVGDGVFETVKVVDGVPFALTRHLDRLPARRAGSACPTPTGRRVLRDAVRRRPRRPTPTAAGRAAAHHRHRRHRPARLRPRRRRPDPGRRRWRRSTAWAPTARSSSCRGPATSAAADRRAQDHVVRRERRRPRPRQGRAGRSEALFANTAGELCEGTGSNVFVVLDGELVTPPLSSGCLAGVTRALVLEWTGAVERDLPLACAARGRRGLPDLLDPGRAGRARRGRRRVLPDAPGPVTRQAAATFAERAAADVDP